MSVEESIRFVLPSIGDDAMAALLQCLFDCGVETADELQYVKEEDLQHVLKKIQVRKLLEHWGTSAPLVKKEDIVFIDTRDPIPVHDMVATASTSITSTSITSTSIASSDDLMDITIPWEKMPPSIFGDKRLQKDDRNKVVHLLANTIRQKCVNPPKKHVAALVRRVVMAQQKSLADLGLDGMLLGQGYYSLLEQVKTRINYLNRGTSNRIRSPKAMPTSLPRQSLNLSSYGCKEWQPVIPAGGHIEQEATRASLLGLYASQGPQAKGMPEIIAGMGCTYPLQRQYLNCVPPHPIAFIIGAWPFLFTTTYFIDHFVHLTGVDPLHTLIDEMTARAKQIMNFLTRSTGNVRGKDRAVAAMARIEDPDSFLLGAMSAIIDRLQEDENNVFIIAGTADTSQRLEVGNLLPATPRLIVRGASLLEGESWMISVEGKIILQSEEGNFREGIISLFAAFYIFNLEYPATAATIYEFMQRCFFKIDDSGTRCRQMFTVNAKGKQVQRKRQTMSPRVVSLITEVAAYDWTEN